MTTDVQTLTPPTTNILKRAWKVVRDDWRAYITLNILYYGIVILGMIYVAFFNPGLQKTLLDMVGQAFTGSGPLAAVGGVYGSGQVIGAMAVTFVVNLFLGTVIEMTIPSLIIPFLGILMGIYRAVLWGLLLSPAEPSLAVPMIPHMLTLILEGQGYILAMLAIFIHGKALIRPQAYGITGHWNGYVEGLRRTGWIYLLVVITLAAAAIYEALEVILLVPLLH